MDRWKGRGYHYPYQNSKQLTQAGMCTSWHYEVSPSKNYGHDVARSYAHEITPSHQHRTVTRVLTEVVVGQEITCELPETSCRGHFLAFYVTSSQHLLSDNPPNASLINHASLACIRWLSPIRRGIGPKPSRQLSVTGWWPCICLSRFGGSRQTIHF